MANPNIITSINLADPKTLIRINGLAVTAPQFLVKRYFPTNPTTDIFTTPEVLVERMDRFGKKLAPFIKEGEKTTTRTGYGVDHYVPARIAPKRRLSIAGADSRIFGENPFSPLTPEERAIQLTVQDLKELNANVELRLEAMAGQLLTENKYDIAWEAPDGSSVTPDAGVQTFIDTETGDSTAYTPDALWDASSHDILGDISAMVRKTVMQGGRAEDIVLGANAMRALKNDAEIAKQLENRRWEIGNINPAEFGAAVLVGRLNIDGKMLNVFEYFQTYETAAGEQVPFFSPYKVMVGAPNLGRTLFAAVTQTEQHEHGLHTYMGRTVPKYTETDDEIAVRMVSRPVMIPNLVGNFTHATVCTIPST